MTKFDQDHIQEFAMEQIQAGLLDAGLDSPAVTAYLRKAEPAILTRTHGRREVAFLNRAWVDVLALDVAVDTTAIRQRLLEQVVNALPCRCAGVDGRCSARSFLYQAFQPPKVI